MAVRGRVKRRVALVAGLVVVACGVVVAAVLAVSPRERTDGVVVRADAPVLAAGVSVEALPPGEVGEPGSVGEAAPGPDPRARIDVEWLARAAGATGIPDRALLAYAWADLVVSSEEPSCGIGWNTLAGIGAVESDHGRHGGQGLDENGYPSAPIRGGALNGDGVMAIPDTDGGVWDGDTVWDRAVGPMQFIPETWYRWGADASGDGIADPDQIDDAALAAARYLCASGPMQDPAGWRHAILSYNDLDQYVSDVARLANRYAEETR
ncbi:membrane-bound lytic murein transglycosylase B [Microbacterium resistens]|uniref:Membrane-bound lytic murein transglycosylase B n=1 Tax=Microbacterium resistens TaxID=156977 RepID=A0ABU1SAA6_9MICO|nr:lytic murein transglycosylase [Microbacterium resistens]MDR6866548.1 membrane-bound lytic murein transglycosylase B [Microbacterium resistens]